MQHKLCNYEYTCKHMNHSAQEFCPKKL